VEKEIAPQSSIVDTTGRGMEIMVSGVLLLCYAFQVDLLSFVYCGSPLWSSGQSFWLQIQRSWAHVCLLTSIKTDGEKKKYFLSVYFSS
jgi:hypothetical protein